MAYADTTYYRSTYIGRTCTDDDTLEKWLARAADDLDCLTLGGIVVADLTAANLEYLKKANCAQAENYVISGDGSDSVESFSIGAFSMKQASGSTTNVICDRASRYLFQAGLGFRGVQICNRYRR